MHKKRIRMDDGSEFTVFYLKSPPVKVNDKTPNKMIGALVGPETASKLKKVIGKIPQHTFPPKHTLQQSAIFYKKFFGGSNKNNWDI